MCIRYAGPNVKKHRCVALYVLRKDLDAWRFLNIKLLKDNIFIDLAKKIPGFEKKYLLTNKCDIIDTGDLNEDK